MKNDRLKQPKLFADDFDFSQDAQINMQSAQRSKMHESRIGCEGQKKSKNQTFQKLKKNEE